MICKMDEYQVWHESDRHEYAFHWPINVSPQRRDAKDQRHENGARFLLLAGQRAQEIVDRLQIKDLQKSACVNCHTLPVPKDIPADRFVPGTDGVTCVACHGAVQDWAPRHQAVNDPQWRKLTRKEKERDYGMVDLWNPVTHASKCLSCHIGNAAERKVITHEMYAAGHPALPGIEVAAFGDLEPRHWRYLREKPRSIQQFLGFDRRRMEQTELVVASAIVALRESMKLYVAGFQMGGPSERAASGWPDFARYDCYACHHELQAFGPSSRADPTGESGAIGRPTIPNWSQVLVGLGVEAVDPKVAAGRLAHIKSLLRRFREALRAQPFGDRELASKVALEIVDWSNPVLTELEAMTEAHEGAADRVIDRKVAIGLLHRLCQIGRESALDYDAARQVAWAFRTIYREVVPTPSDRLPDALRGARFGT